MILDSLFYCAFVIGAFLTYTVLNPKYYLGSALHNLVDDIDNELEGRMSKLKPELIPKLKDLVDRISAPRHKAFYEFMISLAVIHMGLTIVFYDYHRVSSVICLLLLGVILNFYKQKHFMKIPIVCIGYFLYYLIVEIYIKTVL